MKRCVGHGATGEGVEILTAVGVLHLAPDLADERPIVGPIEEARELPGRAHRVELGPVAHPDPDRGDRGHGMRWQLVRGDLGEPLAGSVLLLLQGRVTRGGLGVTEGQQRPCKPKRAESIAHQRG